MCEEILGLPFLGRGEIVCHGIIGQSASLAHLLEDDAVHAAAKVFVEEFDGGVLVKIGLPAFVDKHAHIDVLGIIRCDDDLGLRYRLQLVGLTFWHRLQVLFSVMQVGQAAIQFLLSNRTVVEDLMLVLGNVLQEVEQFLRIGLAKLLLGHVVAHGIVRAIKGILTQHRETAALLRLLVLTILQDESNHLLIGILIDLSIVE